MTHYDAMTHYDVLGISRAATLGEVRRAYVAQARLHHPDVDGGDADRMRALNDAWTTLSDPVQRARYDQTLGGGRDRTADPSPARAPSHEVDDVLDDMPIGPQVVLPRWLALVPVATFAASVAAGGLGLLMGSPGLLGGALVLFLLASTLFVASPFVALMASRRPAAGQARAPDL